MEQTDRQTDKTTRWAFTAYEGQWPLFATMNDTVAEWGWQTELCPTTQKPHYQGYLRTKRQVRHAQLRKILPGVRIEAARDWNALLEYCKKKDTAVPGTQVHQISTTQAMTMAQALTKLASYADNKPPTDFLLDDHEKRLEKYVNTEYWKAVRLILEDNPDEVGLWTQPQYLRAWIHTRSVWIKKSTTEYNDASRSDSEVQVREESSSSKVREEQREANEEGSE